MRLAEAVLVVRQLTSRSVEALSEEKALELATTHSLRMVLPIQAVVVAARITAQAAVVDQELSLFVIHFQLRHSIRQFQLSLAHLALVQRCQRQQAHGRGRQLRTCTNGSAQQLLPVCTPTSLLQPTTPMLRLNLTLGTSFRHL
jgi:hypothetical protein